LRFAPDEQGHGHQPHGRNRHCQDDEHEHYPDASPDCHVTPPRVSISARHGPRRHRSVRFACETR
jgi:hypothetical protein